MKIKNIDKLVTKNYGEIYLNYVKLPQKVVVNTTMEQENRENIEKNVHFRFFIS